MASLGKFEEPIAALVGGAVGVFVEKYVPVGGYVKLALGLVIALAAPFVGHKAVAALVEGFGVVWFVDGLVEAFPSIAIKA